MDRRNLLKTLTGQTRSLAPAPPSHSFSKYSGSWNYAKAAHLLRRTTFGPTTEDIEWSVNKGLQATIDRLFRDLPMPAPPLNLKFGNDPYVPKGQTWVNARYSTSTHVAYRQSSLYSWTYKLILEENLSIREKLTLFWHNHFPISEILDPKFMYHYISIFRKNPWGNFKDITKKVTIDPAMLRFLNGNANRAGRPNENYARELLELFTIGKGEQVQSGDYTNYTEHDVRQLARILTGWEDYGFTNDSKDGSIGATFISSAHDTGSKTLSARFNNATISNMGNKEYAHVIDVIFNQPEVARHISRKLYQWFVYYDITPEVEENIIKPMGQMIKNNNYVIEPAIRALLSSNHFFDNHFIGAMVKNPIDFIISGLKPFKVEISNEPIKFYDSAYSLYGLARDLQMQYYFIPQVAGWRAYYISPGYYRDWVNSSSLPERYKIVSMLTDQGIPAFQGNGVRMKIDVLRLANDFPNPFDPNDLIEDFAKIALPRPLTSGQLSALKNVLIPGLPDFEWTVEYGNHVNNPGDSKLARAVENKLLSMVNAMLTMAEYQLI